MAKSKPKKSDDQLVISPFRGEHDHKHCQSEALSNALDKCKSLGLRLTNTRRQVLEIIWESHNPMGAYEVLQQLQQQGHKPAPPTAYRALDFLLSAGLVHRIESLNAFVGCPSPEAVHLCQFYICDDCGHIAEVNNAKVAEALSSSAEQLGFASQQPVIEVHGLCQSCR